MTTHNLLVADRTEVLRGLPSTYEVPEVYQSKPMRIGLSRIS